MRPVAVMACFLAGIDAFNHAFSVTNLVYEVIGWWNCPLGIGIMAVWFVSGGVIAFKGA